jgi:CHAD domain-containing protein
MTPSYQSFERLLLGNPPEHLTDTPWLEFEQMTARSCLENLEREMKLLAKKANAKRVHDTRVALRRWDSIWSVLQSDGWETEDFKEKVASRLRKLHSRLGKLRDWDVNIETALNHGLSDQFIKDWLRERGKLGRKVKKAIKKMNVPKLLKRLRRFVEQRPAQMADEYAGREALLHVSAYEHLEQYLTQQERTAHQLEQEAITPEELHKLRLSIKAWRYLLAEFYMVTNLELVRAQQILGKLNDVWRVLSLLQDMPDEQRDLAKNVIADLQANREKLLKEFTDFREALPYGLRPSISSTAQEPPI